MIEALRRRYLVLFERLLGRRKRDDLPVLLDRRRIYILPTRHGVLLGVVTFFMLLGALNYNNNIGLMFTFLLSSVAVLSTLFAVQNLVALQVVSVAAEPTFAGRDAQVAVTLDNPAGQRKMAVGARCGSSHKLLSLPANGALTYRLRMPTSERGWQFPERLRLYTIYPFGMFNAWAWIRSAQKILVYPALESDPPPLPASGAQGDGARQLRGEEEFTGVRDYQKGDRPHQIAWKAAARSQQLLSKEMAQPGGTELLLDYQSLTGLDVEARLSRLATWVTMARDRNAPFILALPDRSLGPAADEKHVRQCLTALATFQS